MILNIETKILYEYVNTTIQVLYKDSYSLLYVFKVINNK